MSRLTKSVAFLLVAFLVSLVLVSAAPAVVERPVTSAVEASDPEEASFGSLYDMYKPLYDQYYTEWATKSLVARRHEDEDHDECDEDDSCNDHDDDEHDECDDDDSCDNGDYGHDECDDGSCDEGHEESIAIGSASSTTATVIYPPFPPLPPFPPYPPPAVYPPFPPFPPSS